MYMKQTKTTTIDNVFKTQKRGQKISKDMTNTQDLFLETSKANKHIFPEKWYTRDDG